MEEKNILRHEKSKPKKIKKVKDKEKKHKFLKGFVAVIAVSAVTLGGAYLYKIFAPGQTEENNEKNLITYSPTQTVETVLFKNSLIVNTIDGIKMINKNGEEVNEEISVSISSYVRGMKEPVFQTNNKTVLIFDIMGKTAVLFNEAGVIQSYNYSGDIISGKMSDSGYFTMIVKDSGSKAAVKAYSDKGSELLTWYSGKGFVADASIHNSKKRMAVVTNEIENGDVSSKMLLFSLDNSEPYMGKNLSSSICTAVSFYGDSVFALCENGVYVTDKDNNINLVYNFSNEKMKHFNFFDNGNLMLISENSTGENYHGTVFNRKGKMISEFKIESFLDIADAGKNEFIVIKRKGVFNINHKGKIKKEIPCQFEVKDAKYFGGKIAVLSQDKIFFE